MADAAEESAYRFVFTGHSLGAGVASLLYHRYSTAFSVKNLRLIVFGCPGVFVYPRVELNAKREAKTAVE